MPTSLNFDYVNSKTLSGHKMMTKSVATIRKPAVLHSRVVVLLVDLPGIFALMEIG
jgi:hypothetical protein